MTTPSGAVQVVVAAAAELGESPVWDARSGRLAWVDILGRSVHLTDPRTGATETIEVPLDVGSIAPRAAGGFVAALQDGFWVVGDGPPRRVAAVPEAGPGLRFNDGKCDPSGRFWAGTTAYAEAPGVACLYCLGTDGSVQRALDGVSISNGLAWSHDGRTMFYVDTPTRRIDAFSFEPETGRISDRRPIVEIPPEQGWPDGMAIDAEGGLWVALWAGAAVHRYVGGRLDRRIALPVTKPTSCAFGGTNLDMLYVTSAWSGHTPSERESEPLAGSLLRVDAGVRGLPPSVYQGV